MAELYSSAPQSRPVVEIIPQDSDTGHTSAEALRIAAITPFTTIDYPGKLSAVAFVQGCPWRCIYCQNPWMHRLEELLKRRRGLLDAVVFSGGEPTVDPALPDAVARVKAMGFKVGLHTGGIIPARLARLLPMLDWVGIDVKAPPTDAVLYERVTGRTHAALHFLEAFRMLQKAGIPFECRTTAHPDYLPNTKLLELAHWLKAERVDTFALQIYRRPRGIFATLPAVGSDYPNELVVSALKGAVKTFIERR